MRRHSIGPLTNHLHSSDLSTMAFSNFVDFANEQPKCNDKPEKPEWFKEWLGELDLCFQLTKVIHVSASMLQSLYEYGQGPPIWTPPFGEALICDPTEIARRELSAARFAIMSATGGTIGDFDPHIPDEFVDLDMERQRLVPVGDIVAQSLADSRRRSLGLMISAHT